MAAKKEEVPVPELSGNALTLKENMSYAEASSRLNQIDGFKFELKEYKRSKDVKFKIKASKGLENSGLNFNDPLDENNSFQTEEDATFGLLSHLGYTLEMEKNYKNALEDGKDSFSKQKIYSQSESESILGEVGIPIKEEYVPAMKFVDMLKYTRESESESPFKHKSFDDFLEKGMEIAKEAERQYKENKAKEEAERLEKERIEAEKNKPVETDKKAKKAKTKKVSP